MNRMLVQKEGDAAMGSHLERLQAQNSMLQKVSRKLQEEVRLLRSGNSLPGADVGEAESLDSLN